jgi:hypothetical protein
MSEIENLFDGSAETALLYFSGHGYENTTGAEIVLPQNIEEAGQYYSGIQMTTIMDIVNRSKSRNKIIILDCCHSGHLSNYSINESVSIINAGVSILTACRGNEYAVESGCNGIFTKLLCEALNGGAADFCGNITIGSIYAFIDRALGPWDQRPVFKTNVTEFFPMKKIVPKVSTDTIRQLKDLFEDSNSNYCLSPSYEETNKLENTIKPIEPYANEENVSTFKCLQQLQSIGLVEPVDCDYMYYAAMESKSCRLTEIGKYYWQLSKNGRI